MTGVSAFFNRDDPIVIDVVRNGIVESSHALDAVIVDRSGAVVGRAGDAERMTYFRSSLKPLQAAVCLRNGWEPHSNREIAVACASHNAEPAHLEAVRSILAAAGLDEGALRCPPALPLLDTEAARAGAPQRILRDCSGKHAAFLAACVAKGWPLETYLDPSHPIQQAVLGRVGELAGPLTAIGVDGCGAPTPALPLQRIALAFGAEIQATPAVHRAMRAEPFFVAGTGRVCTDVMTAVKGDLVLKAGAEGLMCFASPSAGIAGAIKSRDGYARAVAPATMWALSAFGLVSRAEPASLARHATPPVLGGGVQNGALQVRS